MHTPPWEKCGSDSGRAGGFAMLRTAGTNMPVGSWLKTPSIRVQDFKRLSFESVQASAVLLENPPLLAYRKRIGDSHAPGPRIHY